MGDLIPRVLEGRPIPPGVSYKKLSGHLFVYLGTKDHVGSLRLTKEFPWVRVRIYKFEADK